MRARARRGRVRRAAVVAGFAAFVFVLSATFGAALARGTAAVCYSADSVTVRVAYDGTCRRTERPVSWLHVG